MEIFPKHNAVVTVSTNLRVRDDFAIALKNSVTLVFREVGFCWLLQAVA